MQQDANETIAQLSDELRELRQRYTELEVSFSNLKKAEENIRAVSESALDAVIISDQDGNIIFWNKTATEIFGYEAEEILGNPITMLISDEAMGEYSEGKKHVLESGVSLFGKRPQESIAKRKDGSKFLAEFTVSNWKTGDKYYFGGSLRDVTYQKQTEALLRESEKKFKDIFDFAADGILVADSHTRKFYDANNAICQMLGYSREELKNLGVDNIHPTEALPYIFEKFAKRAQDVKTYDLDLPTKRKDGSVFYADVRSQPIIWDGKQCLAGFFRDVTESKQHEETLKESEERFRTVVESSSDAIFITDQNGTIIFWNRASAEMFGYEDRGIVGKSYIMLLPERLREQDQKAWQQFFKTGMQSNIKKPFETVALRKDGSEFPMDITFSGWKTRGQYCFSFIARDITERKRTEQVLITTKEFLESVYNTTPDVLLVTDGNGYITNVNKAVEIVIGFSQKEMVGKHASALFPKGEKYNQIKEYMVTELLEKGFLKNLEASWVRKDGSLCPIEFNITLLRDRNGNRLGGVSMVRDITERKQQEEALREREERFRTMTESSSDAIITADSSGKILYCNKSVERIYGYTTEELVGKSIEVLESAGIRSTSRKKRKDFIEARLSPHVGRTVEGIGIRKDGTEVPVEVSQSHWNIGDQMIFCGIVRDITERKRLEEQLRKSHAELEKKVLKRTVELRKANEKLQISEKHLKEFAGMLLSAREEERKTISTTLHDELGTLALSVTSKISIAKEEVKNNNSKAALKALEEGLAAVRKAVGDLRRVAVDLRPPNLEIMGLTVVLTELIDKIKQQAKFKIIFRNELGNKKIPEDAAIVLYRVIQETLTNITKHAKAANVRISLCVDKKNILLDISDDGVGCNLDKVLYRKGKPKIGIEGMRERVESLEGEFIITSAPKKGTQLNITLPKK